MADTTVQNAGDAGTALARVLEEENALYGELLAVTEAEHRAIIAARIDELTDLLISKERLLSRAEALEEARQEHVQALVGTAAVESARLEDIAARLKGAERRRLLAVRDSLRENMEQLSAANQRNDVLLRAGLHLITKWVNFLASYAASAVTYGNDGNAATQPGRKLLDRQA